MRPFTRLVLPAAVRDAVVEHARAVAPDECCGVLVGRIADGAGWVGVRAPVGNDAASPTTYVTNPRDLLVVLRALRPGEDVLAVYHSHPTSAAVPSRADVAGNTWGESVVHVIVGQAGTEPDVRAWWLTEAGYEPCGVED